MLKECSKSFQSVKICYFYSFLVHFYIFRTDVTNIHYFATAATIGIFLTIFCITLNTSLSHNNSQILAGEPNNENEDQSINMFEDIASYLAGEKVGHLRILLFYSICAVSYHFLLTLKIIFDGIQVDVFQPVREGFKGLSCISLTVFMFWMSHEYRKLRWVCHLILTKFNTS